MKAAYLLAKEWKSIKLIILTLIIVFNFILIGNACEKSQKYDEDICGKLKKSDLDKLCKLAKDMESIKISSEMPASCIFCEADYRVSIKGYTIGESSGEKGIEENINQKKDKEINERLDSLNVNVLRGNAFKDLYKKNQIIRAIQDSQDSNKLSYNELFKLFIEFEEGKISIKELNKIFKGKIKQAEEIGKQLKKETVYPKYAAEMYDLVVLRAWKDMQNKIEKDIDKVEGKIGEEIKKIEELRHEYGKRAEKWFCNEQGSKKKCSGNSDKIREQQKVKKEINPYGKKPADESQINNKDVKR